MPAESYIIYTLKVRGLIGLRKYITIITLDYNSELYTWRPHEDDPFIDHVGTLYSSRSNLSTSTKLQDYIQTTDIF